MGQGLQQTRTQLRQLQQTQGNINSFRTLRQSLGQNEDALQLQRQRVQQLTAAIAATPTPTLAMQRALQRAQDVQQRMTQQTTQQREQLNRLQDALRTAGVNTNNLGDAESRLSSDISRTNNELEEQRRRLDQVRQQQQRLNQVRQQHERISNSVRNVRNSASAGAALGVAGIYGGSRLIGSGTSLDKNISKVQALARLDANSPELQALRDQALKLGATTSFTAAEVASGQAFLSMAGFDPEKIQVSMPGILNLATAGELDLSSTSDIASNILSGMGLQAAEMNRVSDVLTATMTRGNVNIQMLGESMKYTAPVAKIFGVSLETTAALTAKLGDAGIQGSMAGTALRSTLSRLAAPPKAAGDALKTLGVRTTDASGNLREIVDILQDVYDKTKHLANADQISMFNKIAGQEAFAGFSYLVEKTGTGELQQLVKANLAAQGEANAVAKTMANNLAGDWVSLNSAFDGVRVAISDAVKDDLRSLLQYLTHITGGITEWAKANPNLAKTLTKILGGVTVLLFLVAALSTLLLGILGPIAALRMAFILLNLSMAVNPIYLLILALSILAFAVYHNWEAIKQFWNGLSEMTKIFATLATGIGGVALAFKALGIVILANPVFLAIALLAGAALLIIKNWDSVGPVFKAVGAAILDGLTLPIRSAISAVNLLIRGLNLIPGVKIPAIPNIPTLYQAGSFTAALQGERPVSASNPVPFKAAAVPTLRTPAAQQTITNQFAAPQFNISGVQDPVQVGQIVDGKLAQWQRQIESRQRSALSDTE
ncbi:MAG: phage tail tape measure protein, partial [Pseudomonadota bacterium]|nr:phage tail tape measure protein [Pseudomonadota bacterium]